jgi:hypothetical protein
VTTAFDDCSELKIAAPAHRLRTIGRWVADPWPKAAIAFGLALTIVWTAALAWFAALLIGLV